jgi:heme exporter protein C
MDGFAFRSRATSLAGLATAILMLISGWMIFVVAPEEISMGDVQRIVYVHVSVAWCGLAACMAMGITAALYLFKRHAYWDQWSLATAEIGWLCATLTLVTGSIWSHEAWNTWWTWEPRLTSTLLLWLMYAGYFLIRSAIDDGERRARVSAVLAILALADVPMVIMATRWFRGMHPVAPEMDIRMRLALLSAVISFTVLFAWIATFRRRQLEIESRIRIVRCRMQTSAR